MHNPVNSYHKILMCLRNKRMYKSLEISGAGVLKPSRGGRHIMDVSIIHAFGRASCPGGEKKSALQR